MAPPLGWVTAIGGGGVHGMVPVGDRSRRPAPASLKLFRRRRKELKNIFIDAKSHPERCIRYPFRMPQHPSRTPPAFNGQEEEPLAKEASRFLKIEMARRDLSYKTLAELMGQQAGEAKESTQALTNKVNRGRFSFAFFLRACRAMGVTKLDLSELPEVSTRPVRPSATQRNSGE